MFHRVKSEVQETEQNKQPEAEKSYRPGATRTESSESEAPARRYGQSQLKTQEETSRMRSQDETPVQGKYARDADESEDSKRSSYQPSVARSAGYGTSYSGGSTSTYTPPQAPETPYSGSDRTLTIGRGINMSGEIDSCDHLMVEGTVEAALKGAKLLEIAESGTFYGTVEIEEATIAGRFEGDITVNGRLTLKSSGVITGSIAYRELEVEAGAVLDGRMTPLKGQVDVKGNDKYRAGTEASAMAKTKASSSKKDNREPANAESGLFSKAHAGY